MTEVFAYKNVLTGETFAFGGERPDLEVRPNWERVDSSDIPDLVVDEVAKQSHTSRMIGEPAKPSDPDASGNGLGAVAITPSPADVVARQPGHGVGGVLSRNIIDGIPPEVLRAKAAADADAIAMHGVLASNLDGSQTRVRSDYLNADIVNAPPVGDPDKSGAKKQAEAVKKATTRAADRNKTAAKASADKAADKQQTPSAGAATAEAPAAKQQHHR
jgi:hypothetical protein